jgi:hypothetical protein
MLGLEGMQNVTEQINSAKLNPDVHVKKFFSEYTEDVIIQTVQSALRDVKAGEFRQQVMDWLIDQIDEWANEEPAIQDLVHDCKEVRDSGETEEVKLTQLRTIYLLKGTDKLYATNAQIPLDLLSPDDALLERTARTIYQTRIRSVFTNKVAFRAAFEAIGINAGRLKDYDLPPAIIRLLLVKNQILTCKDYVDRDVLAHLGGDSIASNLSFYPQDVVYLPEGMRSSQDLAIKNIFEESFKLDPNRVLGAYKKDIPLWKASIINGAKVLTAVFTSMIFKVVLVWQTFWFTWPLMRFAYDLIRASMLAIPHAAPILNFMFFLSYFLWWAGRTRIFFFEACTTLGSICGKIWQASQNLGNYMKDFQEKMTRNHIEQAKSEIFPKWKEALPLIAAGLL